MIRLTDLQPRWLSPNFFIFLCPCCKQQWLSCKNIPMGNREQRELVESIGKDLREVIKSRDDYSWSFSGNDFATLSVTPSINAEAAGHWHGFITNGEIR